MLRNCKIWMQHLTNPLHIYCRLIDLGLSAPFSRRLGVFYEKHFCCSIFKGFRSRWSLIKKRS